MNEFKLSKETKSISFTFDYSFSFINIKKIVVASLVGDKEWLTKIQDLNLYFTYETKKGHVISFPLSLLAQISTKHVNPIIDFEEFIVPSENKGNLTTLGNYVNKLNIELKSYKGDLKESVVIYFETTPGTRRMEV